MTLIVSTRPDPNGILDFTVQQLQVAEDAGQRVWIMAHMPPGRADVMRDQVRSGTSSPNHSAQSSYPIPVELLQPDCATVPQYHCWTILWSYPHGQLHLATWHPQ